MLGLVPDPYTSKANSQRAQAHRFKVHVAAVLSSAAGTTGHVNNFWTGWYEEVLMDLLLITWTGVDITAMFLCTPLQQGRS